MKDVVSTPDSERLRDLCCTPLLASDLSSADAELAARALKALADPVRLRILSLIRTEVGGRATTGDLSEQLVITQPTVTHHLQTLWEAGFLSRERTGRLTWYAIESSALEAVRQLLDPAPLSRKRP